MDPPEEPSLAIAFTAQVPDFPVAPTEIIAFVLLLLASAVVSGAEVALFSLDATARESLHTRPDRTSQRVLTLLERPRHLLITILLLNTFVNVSAAILAALMTEEVASSFGLSREIVFALEVIALTFVLLVVSEITPKLLASRHAVTYSRSVAGTLMVISRVLYPVVALLAGLLQRMQVVFHNWGLKDEPEILSSDDLKVMAEIGEAHGSLEPDEHEWIRSILDFGDTSVRAIMVNRLDITALPVTATLKDALELIRSTGHSRLPLYAGHLDSILGIVYAKDLLPYLSTNESNIDWTRLMRPPMFVPLGKKLDDLLQDFQRRKTHLAIVVDEYGGTAGLVTLEDVLEEVVGDIQDEHDEDEDTLLEKISDSEYRADARIDLDELNSALALTLDTESFGFETLGGLIFHLAGDIPEAGYETVHDRLQMEVESVENNRIRLVRIYVKPKTDNAESSDK